MEKYFEDDLNLGLKKSVVFSRNRSILQQCIPYHGSNKIHLFLEIDYTSRQKEKACGV